MTMIRLNLQSSVPKWAQPAQSSREVWTPTTETFLATLIGCAKEQAENEAPRASASPELAESGLNILFADDSEDEISAGSQEEDWFSTQAFVRPMRNPIQWRWTFMQPAIIPSMNEDVSATACEGARSEEMEEIAASAAFSEQQGLRRFTFMQPAIIPSENWEAPAAKREEAPVATIEEVAVAPAHPVKHLMCRRSFKRQAIASTVRVSVPAIVRDEAPTAAATMEEIPVAPGTEETPAGTAHLSAEPPQQQVPEISADEIPAPAVAISEPTPAPLVQEDSIAKPEELVAAQPPAQAPPAAAAKANPPAASIPGLLLRAWSWLNRKHGLGATRQLRVAETVSLGDKRFVAVVHVDGRKFLIGGGASGVSLLTQLDAAQQDANAAETQA